MNSEKISIEVTKAELEVLTEAMERHNAFWGWMGEDLELLYKLDEILEGLEKK